MIKKSGKNKKVRVYSNKSLSGRSRVIFFKMPLQIFAAAVT